MDPVTHAVVSRMAVSLDRARAARAGALLPVLGGLAPDVDAVFMPIGWDIYLRVHETGTHSLAGATLLSLALAGVFRWRTGAPFRPLLAASSIAMSTHLALDALSGATIRIAWPFNASRTSIGLVAMADPWFVAPVMAALILSLSTRWRLPRLAPLVLLFLALLLVGKCISRQTALRAYESSAGVTQDERYTYARWGSLVEWWIYDRRGHRLRMWRADARSATLLLTVPSPEPRAAADGLNISTVRNFLLAHDMPFRIVVPHGPGTSVYWSDLRFCWQPSEAGGPGPLTSMRPSHEAIACAIWFGGQLRGDGSVVREFVTIGDYVQER
jgi:membrane-bound metal-dependent hydrolase YbcI (DUF457 family)